MIRFAAILKETGVEPNEGYIATGLGGSNLLSVHDAKTLDLRFDHNKLEVRQVTRDQLARVSTVLSEQFLRWGLLAEDSAKAYSAAMYASVNSALHSRLFLVTGKVSGTTQIQAVDGMSRPKLDVLVLPPRVFTVAFRFVQHLDAFNNMTPVTNLNPSDARWLINKLNWTYGPQANLSFTLVDADWATVDRQLAEPLSEQAFINYVAGLRNQRADLTIFFVGRWKGGEAGGTFYADLNSAVVESNPKTLPVTAGSDPFIVNLAHEVAHFLLYDRLGYLPNHPDTDGVLLSTGIQSSRLSRQLVAQITGVST